MIHLEEGTSCLLTQSHHTSAPMALMQTTKRYLSIPDRKLGHRLTKIAAFILRAFRDILSGVCTYSFNEYRDLIWSSSSARDKEETKAVRVVEFVRIAVGG
jgi:hypothetical protein